MWRDFTLSPVLWSNLKLVLQSDDSEAASDSFLGWLLPRAGAVNALHIEVLESPVGAAGALPQGAVLQPLGGW